LKTFYLPAENWPADESCPVLLDGPEAHHMIKVLRTRPGEEVRLFDGAGRDGMFEALRLEKSRAELRPLAITRHPPPTRRVTLAQGWTKGLRRGWLLEKAVELEAAALWFFQAERSQGRVPEESKESWHAQLVAGAKQCRNPWLPEVDVLPGGVRQLAQASRGFDSRLLLWEEQGEVRLLGMDELGGAGSAIIAVGPEGGFAPAEVEALRDEGFSPVSLGRRILRWETAALLCLGIFWWAGQQEPA